MASPAVLERRARERRQRREAFVDAAEQLFFDEGLSGTTMDRVAATAAFTKRTLYQHFASKDELFLAIVHRGYRVQRDFLARAASAGSTSFEHLQAIVRSYLRFGREHPGYFRATLAYETRYYFFGKSTEGLRGYEKACVQVVQDIEAIVHGAVTQAQRDGLIATTLSPAQLTLIVWGQCLGMVQVLTMREPHLSDAYQTTADELVEQFLSFLQHGLQPRGDTA